MAGETDLHKTLKKEACRWLFRMGYRCIASEVTIRPLGIIDAAGSGLFRPYHNCLAVPRPLHQVCFIEAKASRADFLRDVDCGPMLFDLVDWTRRRKRRARLLADEGKFRACLLHPMANLHYVLAPAGMIQKRDLPPRWGLLSFSEAGINVVVRAAWIEAACADHVESAIARTLTGDIYRADERAVNSVNRELFDSQQSLADRIRAMRPHIVLLPPGRQC